MDRLTCPVTGTTVAEAFRAERRVLQPQPTMAEPFEVVVTRRVSRDCLVSFEGRRYSVPFAGAGRHVDVWGTLREVVVRGSGVELGHHARGTDARLLIDPDHYEGSSTREVERPTPLGRRARLQAGRAVERFAALVPDGTGQRGARPSAGGLRADGGGAPMSAGRRKVDLDARCQSGVRASSSCTRPSVWPNSWRRRAGRS